jgi:predicted AAA+ superfamily ATPase
MINRKITEKLVSALINSPAVALLGSRQVGKTTLALEIAESVIKKPILSLDLTSRCRKLFGATSGRITDNRRSTAHAATFQNVAGFD